MNLQEEQNTLSEKIVLKMDKISKLQEGISDVIDVISMNIQQVSLDGENNDNAIQKQIVSAGQLLSKVDKLKDQIDAGELDGESNLGNILNSTMTETEKTVKSEEDFKIGQPVVTKNKESRSSLFAVKSPFASKKKVRRTVSSMGSASRTFAIENRSNSSFVIAGSAEKDNSDADSLSSGNDENNFKDLDVRIITPEEEEKKIQESPDTQQTAETEVDKAK